MTWVGCTKTKEEVPTSDEKIKTALALSALSALSNGTKRQEPGKNGDSNSTNSGNCENLADRNDNAKLNTSFDPSSPVGTPRINRENPNEYSLETDSPPFNPLTSSTSKDLFKAKKKIHEGLEDVDSKEYRSPQIEIGKKRPITNIPTMSKAVENCEESTSIDDNGHGHINGNSTGEKLQQKNKENTTSTFLSQPDVRLKSQNPIQHTPQHNYYHNPASQESTSSSFLTPHHPYNSAYAPPSIHPHYSCYPPYYNSPYPIPYSNHQHHNSHHTGSHPHTPCNVNPHNPHFNVPHSNSYTYIHPNMSQHNYEKSRPLAPQNIPQSQNPPLVPKVGAISTLDADAGQNNDSVAVNASVEKNTNNIYHEASHQGNHTHRQAKSDMKNEKQENGHKTPNAGNENTSSSLTPTPSSGRTPNHYHQPTAGNNHYYPPQTPSYYNHHLSHPTTHSTYFYPASHTTGIVTPHQQHYHHVPTPYYNLPHYPASHYPLPYTMATNSGAPNQGNHDTHIMPQAEMNGVGMGMNMVPSTVISPNLAPPNKKQRTYSRKDKSLGLLCSNFMLRYGKVHEEDGACALPPDSKHNCLIHESKRKGLTANQQLNVSLKNNGISIDEAATALCVERRRIYDIINILESIQIVSRKCKNTYYWHGTCRLPLIFAKMQVQAVTMWPEDAKRHGILDSLDKSMNVKGYFENEHRKKSVTNHQKEKSLGKLSQEFLQLFLVGFKVISLAEATEKILGEACKNGNNNSTSDDALKAASWIKTKGRRLYDIANVMASIGIIKICPSESGSGSQKNKRSFEWQYKIKPQEFYDILKKEELNSNGTNT